MTATPQDIFESARQAGKEAVAHALLTHKEQLGACGFAWVTIRPARGKLVSYLKSVNEGDNGVYGGWEIWNPAGYNGQNIDIKEAGARAFANVLKSHGIRVSVGSRLD